MCGFLGCDALPLNPIVRSLPRMLHVLNGYDAAPRLEPAVRAAGLDCALHNHGVSCRPQEESIPQLFPSRPREPKQEIFHAARPCRRDPLFH